MRPYSPNSPEAMSRLLAMLIVTDGNLDQHEIEALDALHVYEVLGLSRKDFMQVLVDYCNDISDEAEQDGTIHLIDLPRVDRLLEDVTDRNRRILLCALALDLSKADGTISESEMTLLRYMMAHWNITLDDLENEFIRN
ncbi:TerB family tellurite resistance protein [Gulbenkiania mobilis]|uniref:TerB family tellurite resistance protein n=1 Tax=Gulbenkiania mobilis TaxID=397457 RepID=UPI000AC5EA12|nr:TerB family tellurite resistance protein [Gulbenkiania mobilis]